MQWMSRLELNTATTLKTKSVCDYFSLHKAALWFLIIIAVCVLVVVSMAVCADEWRISVCSTDLITDKLDLSVWGALITALMMANLLGVSRYCDANQFWKVHKSESED